MTSDERLDRALLGTALDAGPARASGQDRGSPGERAPADRDRGSASGARPRRRVWARGRGSVARVARLAGHGGRLSRRPPWTSPGRERRPSARTSPSASSGPRATSRPGRHRRALRPRAQPVRPCAGIRRRDGQTARGRCRARRDVAPGRPPPDRPRNRCSNPGRRTGAGLGRRRRRRSRPARLADRGRRGAATGRGRCGRRRGGARGLVRSGRLVRHSSAPVAT